MCIVRDRYEIEKECQPVVSFPDEYTVELKMEKVLYSLSLSLSLSLSPCLSLSLCLSLCLSLSLSLSLFLTVSVQGPPRQFAWDCAFTPASTQEETYLPRPIRKSIDPSS